MTIALRTGSRPAQVFLPRIIACAARCFSITQTCHTRATHRWHVKRITPGSCLCLSTTITVRTASPYSVATSTSDCPTNLHSPGSFAFIAVKDNICIKGSAGKKSCQQREGKKFFHFNILSDFCFADKIQHSSFLFYLVVITSIPQQIEKVATKR